MNKTIAIASLVLIADSAYAHSHPAVDALTHAVEHTVMNAQTWLPYLLGISLLALCTAWFQIKRHRRTPDSRRTK